MYIVCFSDGGIVENCKAEYLTLGEAKRAVHILEKIDKKNKSFFRGKYDIYDSKNDLYVSEGI